MTQVGSLDLMCCARKLQGAEQQEPQHFPFCRDEEHLSGIPFTQNLQFIMNKEYLLQLRISTFCCKANAYTDDVTIYVDKIYYLLLAATYIQSEDMTLNAPCHMSDACQAKQSYRKVFHGTFDPFVHLHAGAQPYEGTDIAAIPARVLAGQRLECPEGCPEQM